MSGLGRALLPLLGLGLFLGLWEGAVRALALPPSILPAPSAVIDTLVLQVQRGSIWPHFNATAEAALRGLAAAAAIGFVAAVLVAESRTLDRFVYPVVVAVQAMPIVAIGPLLIVWLGFGLTSKIWLVAITCFFPIFIQTVAGLRSAPPELLELYRVHGAGRLRTLIDVKLPSAIDHIFAGLQIAVVLSLIACVVGEFLAARNGLGYLIKAVSGQLNLTLMFAAVLILAVMGATGGLILRLIHARLKFWNRGVGETGR
jgi:NitT/TauT family transport system permease protein